MKGCKNQGDQYRISIDGGKVHDTYYERKKLGKEEEKLGRCL